MRNRKSRNPLSILFVLWMVIIIVAIILSIVHTIGWILITVTIAGVSYRAGKQGGIKQINAQTQKLQTNSRYGKPQPYRGGSYHETYAWGPNDPGSPRGPVMELDAVSPYPPNMTADEANERVTGDPGSLRARLLRDKLGGAHNLFGSNDDK